ncbi:heterodisulfide reductase-related iron-sulfur binding cluster [Nocardioides sp. TF02-7]|uniref:heterodisulfide reductase-related iron-sulfur binding cluster n=1 Tax=Nocardioides sp. TF02-7 TaxID=2917724 RepID=UPI0031F5875E
MLQWTWVGVMHWFVFAAFLFLSTAVAAAYFQLFRPDFAWPVIGHWYPYEWFSEIIGALSTIGIIWLIVYRQRNHPRNLGRRSRFFGSNFWQAYFVELLALFEGSAILFVRAAEWKLDEHAGRAHYPLSSWIGDAIFPDGTGALENLIYAIALFKIVLAMVWLIVVARNLTMGIAWHRFTAWFNIWFKREASGRTALGAMKPLTSGGKPVTLDDIDDLDEDATLGAGSIEDFSWKGILDFTTCTECGRCQSQCPAWNTEKPLSPKLLVTALRDHAYASAGVQGEDPGRPALIGKADADGTGNEVDEWFYNPPGGDFVIDSDVLWSCTSCGACVQQCPVDIEHVDHIMDMRRFQVLVEANFPAELNQLFKGLENKGNPWNMSPSARLDWAKGLDFEVKVVGDTIESLDEVDWLFWVGCAGAYEDRAKKTTRAVAELLDRAGVSFGVLGNGETCSGDPARRAGNEFVFQGLAQQNVEVLTEAKAKQVVTTCPHCMNTLKNEYKSMGIELEVVHHTQLLNRLVRDGKLTPVAGGEGAHQRRITYHDPCYLGRHNQVYSPPRELLQIMPGAEYAEMERNSERSFCCGAGGARMWMEETIGERINLNRTNEAVGTGADQIAVGCPFCRVMLSDGLTAAQANGSAREEVEVLDVAQMLLASVKGEVATKLKPGQSTAAPAARSVETKAEPSAGDVTVTEDTVVATEDAGPLAKASGGTSLFDDPGAATEDAPAAAPAAPSSAPSSSGSLFDEGGGSLFDTPAEAAEEPAKDEPAKQESAKQESAKQESGSLFDEGGSLFDTPAQPAPAKKETPAAPAAEAAPAEPAAAPAPEVPSGGSLFDIAAPEPTAAEPKQAEQAKEQPAPEPAPKPVEEQVVDAEAEGGVAAAAPRPSEEIPSGGSLFDIPAPEPAGATSAPAPGPTPEAEAVEADARAEEAAAVTAPAEESSAAPAAEEPTASSPATEIPAGGSLFDIAAPEPAPRAAAPSTAPTDVPTATGSVTAPDPDVIDETAEAPPEDEDPAEAASHEEPSAEEPETPEPETPEPETPEPETPEKSQEKPRSPSAANQPRTDVDINESGSLFDL